MKNKTENSMSLTSTRLTGNALWIVRVIWLISVVLVLYVQVRSASHILEDRLYVCDQGFCFPGNLFPEEVEILNNAGLSQEFYAWYFILVDTIPSVVALIGSGLLLAWLRNDDWLALYVSLFLISLASIKLPLFDVAPWGLVDSLMAALVIISGPLIMFVFPNGRFLPGWTKWFSIPMIWFMLWYAFLPPEYSGPIIVDLVPLLVIFVGAGASLYRYFHTTDEAQKQQIKWVTWVFPLRPISEFGIRTLLLPILFPFSTQPGLGRMVFHMLAIPLFSTWLFVMTGVALTVSILRYRLWDINFYVNRAVVYGLLTAGLGAVFAGAFFLLRGGLALLLGGQQAVTSAILATALVVGLFGPVRTWLRRLVDRRFYGIELDYVKAVKEYHRNLSTPEKTTEPASTYGAYNVIDLLGRGGMGQVYLGKHPTLNRTVAIKVLAADLEGDDTAYQRFLREAQVVAKLNHPNIVTLYDMGERDGNPYIVMEYVEGLDLGNLLKQQGKLDLTEGLPLLADIAAALDYAHGLGIIHRDIKPSNVMIDATTASGSGRRQRAVLMDFGIARLTAGAAHLTQSGGLMGTLDYISPEQIRGEANLDGRADVYSMGVMAYQMLTGELPFRHSNPGALVMAHMMEPAPDPRDKVPELPQAAATAIMRAMAKESQDRFMYAGEMVSAMQVEAS
ncbi:MAG: serine/threonine protein kinase [Anaerolineae bacterium]|nr:MAG: serine/threonine protein kinase [Anaerolineae bacterium]